MLNRGGRFSSTSYATQAPTQNGMGWGRTEQQGGPSAEISRRNSPDGSNAKRVWEASTPVKVQGGTLKTWSFLNAAVERMQVIMKTDGRPLEADVELWQGPDNSPQKMRIYVEDGAMRTFSAVIDAPRGPNTVAIRNTAMVEFPLDACVEADTPNNDVLDPMVVAMAPESTPRTIQGGALKTYPFDPFVQSVQVLLRTDGRPLNARIELLQGPNNNKQVVEVYTEDGMERPFFLVLETPGSGNVVRIVNTATVEFPMTAWVEAYETGNPGSFSDVIIS